MNPSFISSVATLVGLEGLVTSANLTYHGLEANIEMGLRVKGPPAAKYTTGFTT